MFDFEFAYSKEMQIILIFISCITTLLFYTFTTNIILTIYGEKVNPKHKAFFIFITGIIMNTFWIYGFYYAVASFDFSQLTYNLVTVPNPVFALFYFLLGVKLLKLSPYRSIRLITNVYIFIMAVKIFHRMVGFVFFPQTGAEWNFLSDAVSLVVNTVIYFIFYKILIRNLKKSEYAIRLVDRSQSHSLPIEILFLFLKTGTVYIFSVFFPLYINTSQNIYLLVMFTFIFAGLLLNILNDALISEKKEIINKAAHAKILNDVIDGFSGLRHDFNNILQTYGGYIAIGDLDSLKMYHQSVFDATVMLNENDMLNKKLNENPSLISLLIEKNKLAKSVNVNMRVNIVCNIVNLFISSLDLCRSVGNLLDNAIEASKESQKNG